MPSNPAPGELELVRAFVNTWDADDDTESLADPAALCDWLAGQGLLEPGSRVTAADHRHALELRESLRALLMANAGLDLDPAAGETLDRAAQRAKLTVRF